jgi:hypothetical protein
MAYRNREEEKLERREEQNKREQQAGTAQPGGEKERRSWKEIDARREGARGRSGGDDRGPPRAKGETPAYRSYKSKLDRLFTGDIKINAETEVAVVRSTQPEKPAPTPLPVSTEPLSPKEQLKAAQSDDEIVRATRAVIAAGSLPLDGELLLKVISQSNAELYFPALEALLDAMEKGRPKNHKAIVARLDVLLPSLSGEAAEIARGIRSRLG